MVALTREGRDDHEIITSKINGQHSNSVEAEHAQHDPETAEQEWLTMRPLRHLTLPRLLLNAEIPRRWWWTASSPGPGAWSPVVTTRRPARGSSCSLSPNSSRWLTLTPVTASWSSAACSSIVTSSSPPSVRRITVSTLLKLTFNQVQKRILQLLLDKV